MAHIFTGGTCRSWPHVVSHTSHLQQFYNADFGTGTCRSCHRFSSLAGLLYRSNHTDVARAGLAQELISLLWRSSISTSISRMVHSRPQALPSILLMWRSSRALSKLSIFPKEIVDPHIRSFFCEHDSATSSATDLAYRPCRTCKY